MQIKDIEIENFRGFDKLKVEDFGRINVIVGRNNSGKTSLIEGILLASIAEYPYILPQLNRLRELPLTSIDDLKVHFYELSLKNKITLSISYINNNAERRERAVKIEAGNSGKHLVQASKLDDYSDVSTGFINRPSQNQITVDVVLEDKSEIRNQIVFDSFKNDGVVLSSTEKEPVFKVIFLSSTTIDAPTLERLAYFKQHRLEGQLVQVLQGIDSRIRDIDVIKNEIFFDLDGLPERMPASIMGEGSRRILSVLSALVDVDDSTIVFIDEIENGLHYSAHKMLWEGIIRALRSSKAQLFVTTHNIETLKYLQKALEIEVDFQSEVRCFNIVKTKKAGYKAYKYSYEGFAGALENEIEIRR